MCILERADYNRKVTHGKSLRTQNGVQKQVHHTNLALCYNIML